MTFVESVTIFYQYQIGPDAGVNDGTAQCHNKHGRVDDEEGAYPRIHLCQWRAAEGPLKSCSPHPTKAESTSLTR